MTPQRMTLARRMSRTWSAQSVEEATATLEAAGFTLRVVQRDGEDLAVTADFLENRVNVAVETQQYGEEVVTEVVSTG